MQQSTFSSKTNVCEGQTIRIIAEEPRSFGTGVHLNRNIQFAGFPGLVRIVYSWRSRSEWLPGRCFLSGKPFSFHFLLNSWDGLLSEKWVQKNAIGMLPIAFVNILVRILLNLSSILSIDYFIKKIIIKRLSIFKVI